jgi:hypothetical protein
MPVSNDHSLHVPFKSSDADTRPLAVKQPKLCVSLPNNIPTVAPKLPRSFVDNNAPPKGLLQPKLDFANAVKWAIILMPIVVPDNDNVLGGEVSLIAKYR